MKQFITFIICSFSLLIANAQPPKGMGTSDPDAKKILDAVSAKFKTYKTVKAGFALKVEGSNGKSQGNKAGTVYMKGTKYYVNITGQEIFLRRYQYLDLRQECKRSADHAIRSVGQYHYAAETIYQFFTTRIFSTNSMEKKSRVKPLCRKLS
jgi:hypothetical protein